VRRSTELLVNIWQFSWGKGNIFAILEAKDFWRYGDGKALGEFGGSDSFVAGDDGFCTADGSSSFSIGSEWSN
jgi:hypothetical protein